MNEQRDGDGRRETPMNRDYVVRKKIKDTDKLREEVQLGVAETQCRDDALDKVAVPIKERIGGYNISRGKISK